jgi:hypothetical protein
MTFKKVHCELLLIQNTPFPTPHPTFFLIKSCFNLKVITGDVSTIAMLLLVKCQSNLHQQNVCSCLFVLNCFFGFFVLVIVSCGVFFWGEGVWVWVFFLSLVVSSHYGKLTGLFIILLIIHVLKTYCG